MTLDLSDGGMAVLAKDCLSVGAQPFVRFVLPGTDIRIECKAMVMWARADGQAGLRFVHLPENARQDIVDWFSKHRPKRITPRNGVTSAQVAG